jgi:hypothetical protein
MEEAIGDLDLHPWELWEYTIGEVFARRKGRRTKERREYQQVRQLAYCVLLPYLDKKARNKSIDQIVPDMYEDQKAKPKLTYKELVEKYRKAGALKGNAGK